MTNNSNVQRGKDARLSYLLKKERQRTCNVTLRHVRVIIVAMKTKQCVLYALLRYLSLSIVKDIHLFM